MAGDDCRSLIVTRPAPILKVLKVESLGVATQSFEMVVQDTPKTAAYCPLPPSPLPHPTPLHSLGSLCILFLPLC